MKIVNNFSYKGPQFKALDRTKDEFGYTDYKFYLPKQKDKVEIEFVKLEKGKDGFYKPLGKPISYKLTDEGDSIYKSFTLESSSDLADEILTDENGNSRCFGYRYLLNGQHFIDSGMCTNPISQDPNAPKYTIVNPDRPIIKRNGITQLIMTDTYDIGASNFGSELMRDERKIRRNSNFRRNFVNKYGGNLAGITLHAKDLAENECVRTIVGMPFTRDTMSSHKYWTQNPFLVSDDIGDLNLFKKMQQELFKNGINYCLDAALVNEGLTGTRFQHVLKWGKESPYYYSFNINSDRPALAILPKDLTNVAIRIVNAPETTLYNRTTPTYIQFYDTRLVTGEQLNDSGKLITEYENPVTKDSYDIISYYDSLPPYYFEIDHETLAKCKMKAGREDSKYKGSNVIPGTSKAFSIFCNTLGNGFAITEKTSPEGVDFWDGSVDIPKIKFFPNQTDDALAAKNPVIADRIKMGYVSAQDTAIHSIEYWTDQTRQALMEYIGNLFNTDAMNKIKDVDSLKERIIKLIDSNYLPKSLYDINPKTGEKSLKLSDDLLESIMDKYYSSSILNSQYINYEDTQNSMVAGYNADTIIYNSLRNYPLQAFDCANDLSAVLSSPYINKVAQRLCDIENGVNRNKEFKPIEECSEVYNRINTAYRLDLLPFTKDVMEAIGKKTGNRLIDHNNNLTDFGKYLLPMLVPEVMTYVLRLAFTGTPQSSAKNSELTLVGEKFASPKAEAEAVSKKLIEGFKILKEINTITFKNKMCTKFGDLNPQGLMLADAIIDKTEAGLGMRIDASKDVASYDNVKQGKLSPDGAWERSLEFWNKAQKAMNRINPHNLTYAEITDLENFPNYYSGKSSVLAASKMFDRITAAADYTHFFSKLAGYAAGDLAEYTPMGNSYDLLGNIYGFYASMVEGWDGAPGKLREMPADGIALSYTFANNHDKPRIVHSLSLNAELYKSDFKNPKHCKIAADLLGIDDPESINYENLSPKAVAVGHRFSDAFEELLKRDGYSQYNNDEFKKALKEAIAFYVAGQIPVESLKKKVSSATLQRAKMKAETFGVRSFELTITDILNHIKENTPEVLKNTDIKAFKDSVMDVILTPALDKYLTMYKTMVCLPGAPTDFAGDKMGMTGFESFAKNIYQTNREPINWSRIGAGKNNIYNTFYSKSNEIAKIRKEDKLSALNDGETVVLTPFTADANGNRTYINHPYDDEGNKRDDVDYISVLRYNSKGSVVLSTFVNDGIKKYGTDYDKLVNNELKRDDLYIDEILLTPANPAMPDPKAGLVTGLPDGLIFKKYNDESNGYYKVVNETVKIGDRTYLKSVLRYFDNNNKPGKIHISPNDYNVGIFYTN